MNETYVGEDEARGIPCHLWTFAGPIPDMGIKMVTILWYFDNKDRWTSATGKSQIPIAAKWYGEKVNYTGTDIMFLKCLKISCFLTRIQNLLCRLDGHMSHHVTFLNS